MSRVKILFEMAVFSAYVGALIAKAVLNKGFLGVDHQLL